MESALESYDHYYGQVNSSFESRKFKASSTYFDMCYQIISDYLLTNGNISHESLAKYLDLSKLVTKFEGPVFCKRCVSNRLNAFYVNLLNIHQNEDFSYKVRLLAGEYLCKMNDKLINFYKKNNKQSLVMRQLSLQKKVYRKFILLK